MLLAALLERARACARCGCGSRASAARRAAASTASACRPICARTRASSRRRCAARIELNPLRAFDSDHPGTREVMESAPRLLDHLSDDGRRALRGGARAARRGERRLRDRPHARARSRLLHAHGVRVHLRRARRAERRRRRRALRRPRRAARRPATPGVGWAAGVERILLAGEVPRGGRRPRSSCSSRSRSRRALGPAPSACSARRARRG